MKARLYDERGMAVITAIVVIAIGLAVGGVAAVTATNAMRGSERDERTKDAFAAAEAGAELALLRQNQIAVSDVFPCVSLATGTLVAGIAGDGGWCGEFEGTVGDATYSYRVRPPVVTELLSRVEIVSTGTSNGVTRRIHTIAESPTATAIFADATVIGDYSITLDSNSRVHGNAATNGDIVLNGNADLCGAAQFGEAGVLDLNNNASHGGRDCAEATYPSYEGTVNLPPVDQGDVANPLNNDNDRIDPGNPLALDTVSGNGNVTFANRRLVLDSNSALTLGGGDYSFCQLVLNSNTELIVAAGANVRIFFDTPENCGLVDGPQIHLNSNSRLTTTSGSPASLQLLVVGSADPEVTSDNVVLDSNSRTTMPLILYAPNSAIEMNSNSSLLGAVAGQSIHLDSNATVTSHTDSSGLELPLPLSYKQTQFIECTSQVAPATAPSSTC